MIFLTILAINFRSKGNTLIKKSLNVCLNRRNFFTAKGQKRRVADNEYKEKISQHQYHAFRVTLLLYNFTAYRAYLQSQLQLFNLFYF